jgi:hypothetical protein
MTRLWKLYQTHFLVADPIITLAFGVGFWQVQERVWGRQALITFLDGNHQVLYGTLTTISATLLGFVLAAFTVILSYSALPKFQELSAGGHWGTIFRTYFQASIFFGVETFVGFLGLVLDTDKAPQVTITYVVTGLAVFCTLRFARCVWILTLMTAISIRPDSASPVDHRHRFRSPGDIADSQLFVDT